MHGSKYGWPCRSTADQDLSRQDQLKFARLRFTHLVDIVDRNTRDDGVLLSAAADVKSGASVLSPSGWICGSVSGKDGNLLPSKGLFMQKRVEPSAAATLRRSLRNFNNRAQLRTG